MTTDVSSMTTANASVADTSTPRRYNAAMVTLHWVVAILIFSAVFLAKGGERDRRRSFQQGGNGGAAITSGNAITPSSNAAAPGAAPTAANVFSTIGLHMIFGMIVMLVLIARLLVRLNSNNPAWASTGSKFLDKIGELTHAALYFFTFSMTVTGIILAVQRNQFARTFGIGEIVERTRTRGFTVGSLHGMSWFFLILLIMLHVGAVLYHQFIVKDNMLSRMWYGGAENAEPRAARN